MNTRVQTAIKHPGLAFYYLGAKFRGLSNEEITRKHVWLHLNQFENKFLKRYAGFDKGSFRISEQKENLKQDMIDMCGPWAAILYPIIRIQKPKHIIETGVNLGLSSAVILSALQQNNNGGILHSIDYPFTKLANRSISESEFNERFENREAYLKKYCGYYVPDKLKNTWDLIFGKELEVLPKLLVKLGQIDIFVHDSIPYDNQKDEYELVFSKLTKGGVIFSGLLFYEKIKSDFEEFVKEYDCESVQLPFPENRILGIAIKTR